MRSKKLNFIRNPKKLYVYKKVSENSVIFLVLYVDDIHLIGNDIRILDSVKSSLIKIFSMKDLSETIYILGIWIFREKSKRLIGLSQSIYIEKALEMFNM
jgi:Reverse transcriptase (RNA-dependent DNA polymerase)